MIKLDALGKACPLPVIETKKALQENDVVEIVVDNEIATQNLKKLAEQQNCSYQMTVDSPTHYTVVIAKTGAVPQAQPAGTAVNDNGEYIVVVNTDVMGRGSDELGKNLLKTFIYTLTEQDILPKRIIFYNGGVPYVTEGSEVLEDLRTLVDKGVEIYACGACLNFFKLTDKVVIGEVTNMFRIVEMMRSATRIVQP